MEKIKARSVHRFAFPRYGWVALLMLASALVGAAAGHAFAVQPTIAAPATAPVLAQAEPGQSTATDISDDAQMTGTYLPGMQGLHQPGTAISVNAAQMTGTYQPGMQGLQLPATAASNVASQDDLRWEMNALRQARRAVRPAADVAPVEVNTAGASTAVEQYRIRVFEQKQAALEPVDANTAPVSPALEQYDIRVFQQKQAAEPVEAGTVGPSTALQQFRNHMYLEEQLAGK